MSASEEELTARESMLLQRVKDLEALRRARAEEIHEIHKELVRLRYPGLEIGAVVRTTHRSTKRADGTFPTYRVANISQLSSRKPWVVGNPRKKDGTFSNSIRNLFSDWEVVVP